MNMRSLDYVHAADSQQAVLSAMRKFLDVIDAEVQLEVNLKAAMAVVSPFARRQIPVQRLIEIESFFSAACLRLGEIVGPAANPPTPPIFLERRAVGQHSANAHGP
jgi:hypothetical protein